MSVASVPSFPPATSEPSSDASVRSGHIAVHSASQATEGLEPPVSGPLSKPGNRIEKNATPTDELPQDVVELHQDPEIRNQVIIQYLDQAKNVVLQVPSQQELSVERGIAQDFQQAAKLRASESAAAAGSEGEKNHGNKL
jgi:hypothetical protein